MYETVNSALGYVGDLQGLLTTNISIVTAELPSEEESVLLFDYVADSCCNIRQEKMTCKGCKRLLKSGTPCAKQLDKV